jgi:hypothetical protein
LTRALVPAISFNTGFDFGGKNRDVLLVGKRKPALSSTLDARRIERHARDCWKMADESARNPELQPG